MFLLVGCVESVVTLSGGLSSGKVAQSSVQSVASYGVKKKTGKTPFGHALNYVTKNKTSEKKDSCLSFVNKQDYEICLMVKKKIISRQATVEEKEASNNESKEFILSLQPRINKKFKIKYLDQ